MLTKFLHSAVILALLSASQAWGFDYARYQAADLDAIIARPRPQAGADMHEARPLRFEATLAAYDEACDTGFLKRAMIVSGLPTATVEATAITCCIKVRSTKGAVVSFFFQDQLTAGLRRDVRLGGPLTLFAIHLYTAREGLGLLVNGFVAGHRAGPGAARSSAEQQAASEPSCECGSPDRHSGTDYSAPEGTPVPVAAAGVVVKVEEDEHASVDTPSAGHCGRYIVIRHRHPDGRVVFTRYAQLGRLVGRDGKPMKVGMLVAKGDKVGEVGSRMLLHVEVRPQNRATMDTRPDWSRRYGADPTMEWSRYQPVDPATFKFDGFGA